MFNLEKFWTSTRRIFTVSKKPDLSEYKVMAQVTGIGIIIIGVIAFIIRAFTHFIPIQL